MRIRLLIDLRKYRIYLSKKMAKLQQCSDAKLKGLTKIASCLKILIR